MIYPITNFVISGVIWYQGESNVGTYSTYKPLMETMIGSWRKAWGKDFPFYYVQIAPYSGYGGIGGVLQREVQTNCLSIPNTGMVVISDLVNDVKDIHPKDKFDVATRLANLALSEHYGKTGLSYQYPMYNSMNIEKDKIRINFKNTDGGLMCKDKKITEFYIAGEDRQFKPAMAKIENNGVIVWSKEVKNPVAVRYCFTNAAMPNLFSKEGLPVNLFRTDNWDDINTVNP